MRDLEARCAALEIHPTAPLSGAGESLAPGEVRPLEEAVAADFPEALAVIGAERMNAERRACACASAISSTNTSRMCCDFDSRCRPAVSRPPCCAS